MDRLFLLQSPKDYFDVLLKPSYQAFLNDNSSLRHAIASILFAYHLFDKFTGESFEDRSFLKHFPGQEKYLVTFQAARAIANSSKHAKVRVMTIAQAGFSSEFSHDFARPFHIQLDKSEITIDYLLDMLIEFWQRQLLEK